MFSFKNSIDIKFIAAKGQTGHWSMSCDQLIVYSLFFLGFISLSLLFITVIIVVIVITCIIIFYFASIITVSQPMSLFFPDSPLPHTVSRVSICLL